MGTHVAGDHLAHLVALDGAPSRMGDAQEETAMTRLVDAILALLLLLVVPLMAAIVVRIWQLVLGVC